MTTPLKLYIIERVPILDANGVEKENLGSWYDADTRELICKTMELPWRGNQRDNKATAENDASCIPEDTYVVVKQPPKADRNYGYFRFKHVPGRSINPANGMSSILVHRITYVKDLLGCIGVGGRFVDLNKDGIPDMVDSSKKLEWMYQNLPDTFLLKITKKPR